MQSREHPLGNMRRLTPSRQSWSLAWPWPNEQEIALRRTRQDLEVTRRSPEGPAGEREQDTEELRGLYIISVAARLLQMHPQTLRKYERVGLVTPSRTIGMLRLYSQEDILKLRIIKHLVEDLKLNLAGVELTLSVVQRLLDLHRHILEARAAEELRDLIAQELQGLMASLEMNLPRTPSSPSDR